MSNPYTQPDVKSLGDILGCVFGTLLFFYLGWGIGQIVLKNYDAMSFRYPKDKAEEDVTRRARNKISFLFGVAFCFIVALTLFPALRKFVNEIIEH
jgi:hypothetical protein